MKQPDWIRRFDGCRQKELEGKTLSDDDIGFLEKLDALSEVIPGGLEGALLAYGFGSEEIDDAVRPAWDRVAAETASALYLVSKAVERGDTLVNIAVGGIDIPVFEIIDGQKAKPCFVEGWRFRVLDEDDVIREVTPLGGLVLSFETLSLRKIEWNEDERILSLLRA